jgi:SAM-dependent methyltransferase
MWGRLGSAREIVREPAPFLKNGRNYRTLAMKQKYSSCEVCGSGDIRCDGVRVYRAPDASVTDASTRDHLAVLFGAWLPGLNEATLRALHCHRCGFAVYEPRPEEIDIDRKYAFNENLEVPPPFRDDNPAIAQRRGASFYDAVASHVRIQEGSEILDFGGGDGTLMGSFLEHGCRCFVVDYHPTAVSGVERLGSKAEDLAVDAKFDGIVCAHVLEHVTDVLALTNKLVSHLRPGGWMYVEVPMELWRRPLPHVEPVTHINFFTPGSVRNLLTLAGLDVRTADIAPYLHSSGSKSLAIKSVAIKPTQAVEGGPLTLVPSDVESWLKPTWTSWAKYVWTFPKIWKYEILRLYRADLR